MPRFSRMVLVLLLTAVLAAAAGLAQPLAGAAPRAPRLEVSASTDLFARLWSSLTRFWSKNGCQVDPSGRCLGQSTVQPAGDNGCQVDPDGGRCLARSTVQTTADNGCEVDPDGRCRR